MSKCNCIYDENNTCFECGKHAPLTNAQKQTAFRKRRVANGQKEMRGIYVTDEEEIEVKKKVRAMLKLMRKGN